MMKWILTSTFGVPCSTVHYSHGFITFITKQVQNYVRHRLGYRFSGIHFDFEVA
jgi:hypothetical protein